MLATYQKVLATKFQPSRLEAGSIARQKLLEFKGDALPKVLLVVAPAGFGKSTYVAQLFHKQSAAAWLSLDANDRDPFVFLKYLISAINKSGSVISPETESFIEGNIRITDIHQIVLRICNDLAENTKELTLILDDFHLAESDEVSSIVSILINISPEHFNIIISSRYNPKFPTSKLKMNGKLHEINEVDLKFDEFELIEFFEKNALVNLGREEFNFLLNKTEGWIAGIRISTLYLTKGNIDRLDIMKISGNYKQFSDYMMEEVVSSLDRHVIEFILYTSVLPRFDKNICNFILDRDDSAQIIELTQNIGLFIVTLDEEYNWFRYHHLFRDFLIERLDREHPGRSKQIYRKASQWFDEHGFFEEAVEMALNADEYDVAAQLIEVAAAQMLKNGNMPQIHRWIERFPSTLLDRRPRLALYNCWALAHMGHTEQFQSALRQFEGDATGFRESVGNQKALLQSEIIALRTMSSLMETDLSTAIELIKTKFPAEPEFHYFSACMLSVESLINLARNAFDQARTDAKNAKHLYELSGSSFGVSYSSCIIGIIACSEGKLQEGLAYLVESENMAVRMSGDHSFAAAIPRGIKALILYEMDEVTEAYRLLKENLPLIEQCGHSYIRNAAYLAMVGVISAQGDPRGALRYLNHILTVSTKGVSERSRATLHYERVRLSILTGDVDAAARLVGGDAPIDDVSVPGSWQRIPVSQAINRCRVLIAMDKSRLAIAPLKKLADLAQASGRGWRYVQILGLMIAAFARNGQKSDAFDTVRRFVEFGKIHPFVRGLLDQGTEVGETFVSYSLDKKRLEVLTDPELSCLRRICDAHRKFASKDLASYEPMGVGKAISVNGVLESLTDREVKVLRILTSGASNVQVSKALNISVNTTRWHVANILSKLQVENRTQAASAALQLGLAS